MENSKRENRKTLKSIIKDFFYSISVKLHALKRKIIKEKPKDYTKRNDFRRNKVIEFGFLTCLFLFPTLAIIINELLAIGESFLLSFQAYDVDTGKFYFISGIDNFINAFKDIEANINVGIVVKNSIINYLFSYVVSFVGMGVSFAIYKKVKCTNLFLVILFLPQIVASIVWSMVFRYLVAYALPAIFNNPELAYLLSGNSAFWTLLIYQGWLTLANSLIITTGTFGRIDKECVEAAYLDGCGLWGEFIHITFPHYFPVWSIGVFTGVAAIFSGTPPLYEFFGNAAPEQSWTFGYYFFQIIIGERSKAMPAYPVAAASGVLFTLIVTPIVFFVKWLVGKGNKLED